MSSFVIENPHARRRLLRPLRPVGTRARRGACRPGAGSRRRSGATRRTICCRRWPGIRTARAPAARQILAVEPDEEKHAPPSELRRARPPTALETPTRDREQPDVDGEHERPDERLDAGCDAGSAKVHVVRDPIRAARSADKEKCAEPVALSSSGPADGRLALSAAWLGFVLPALRARRSCDSTTRRAGRKTSGEGKSAICKQVQSSTFPRRVPRCGEEGSRGRRLPESANLT